MATTKGKSSSRKKSTGAKKPTAKQLEAQNRARRQMWAVVLFALGILFGALALVKGDSFWNTLHNLLFGLFGWGGFLICPILIYIAVMTALEKPSGDIGHKLWQTFVLVALLCGAVQILLEELGRETAELPVQIRLSELTWQLAVEERLAGLNPRPGASLEDRRSAVIAKWRSGGPVTLDQIQAVADAWRNGVVEVGFDGSTITVTFVGELGIPEDLDGLKAALEMTIPAHLALRYEFRYRTWGELAGRTWGELAAYTWGQVLEGEMRKAPAQGGG